MLAELTEQVENDTGNSMKQTVQELSVQKKILTQLVWNGKNTVSVIAVDKFERHA